VKNCGDNVFENIPVGKDEASLLDQFIAAHDFAENTRKAVIGDLRKFARWFSTANNEPFVISRVTVRDVADFRDQGRRNLLWSVSAINRCLVMLRRFFGWLAQNGHLPANPAKPVKELRQQILAPKGLSRAEVRRLLREVELRQDVRATAIFSLLLYTGCRVGDLVALGLHDIVLSDRSGSATFNLGKGNKQRTAPLPLPARKALQTYLETRPPVESSKIFIGERGPLSDKGIRAICDKYACHCGFKLHPHLLRHTMAHQFLEDNPGDLVALAQILGHENLNTTKRYVQKTEQQLSDAADRLSY
jgi:site-specific recombinase XerD